MGKLIMIRHGESEGNRDRRFTISPEVPLTALGERQARAAGRLIGQRFQPEAIISSPFRRARQTSDLIAAELGLPVEVVHDLHERDLGILKGQSYDVLRDLVRQDPTYDAAYGWSWRPAEGESYDDVRTRVVAAIGSICARYPAGEVVVVSHGGVMLSLWAHIIGTWKDAHLPPNCGIVVVTHDREQMQPPEVVQGIEEGELG